MDRREVLQGRLDQRPHCSACGRSASSSHLGRLTHAQQTHNVHIARPIADFVVSLGTDGRIASQGSLSTALSVNKKLAHKVKEEMEEAGKDEEAIDEPTGEAAGGANKSDGKLIVAEEISEGHVGWPARK